MSDLVQAIIVSMFIVLCLMLGCLIGFLHFIAGMLIDIKILLKYPPKYPTP